MPPTVSNEDKISNWPGYWFLLLEHYLKAGNLDGAAVARQELERLGVDVRFHRLQPSSREVGRG